MAKNTKQQLKKWRKRNNARKRYEKARNRAKYNTERLPDGPINPKQLTALERLVRASVMLGRK
jgi:hypothetical protein